MTQLHEGQSMEISTLKLVHDQLLPQMDENEAKHLEQLLQLLRCTCDLQSEPGTMTPELLERVHAFEPKGFFAEIRRTIYSGGQPRDSEWLAIAELATLKWILTERWDDFYAVIFEHDPMLGQEFSKVREFLEAIPFPAALALLERTWEYNANRPELNLAALACIAASGLLGVFGSSRLYEMAAACLAFEKEFLVVVLAGRCFKISAIASRVDIGTWTDTQYACMRVLDNFLHFGETAWG
jgi:hypothetical protein